MPQRRTFAESQIEGDYEGAPFAPDLHDARHLWLRPCCCWCGCWCPCRLLLRARPAGHGGRLAAELLAGGARAAVLVFIVIVGVYCVAMDHFERQDMAAARPARRCPGP